eukprot:gb/GECG01004917.1/.p1 GENE.gb/GECG01004917.1/~~gb/GECG01004917.1/.p1  ORF type:complete len:285 (+),score=26.86 gb/GECG01004917.1/:1-855(+)
MGTCMLELVPGVEQGDMLTSEWLVAEVEMELAVVALSECDEVALAVMEVVVVPLSEGAGVLLNVFEALGVLLVVPVSDADGVLLNEPVEVCVPLAVGVPVTELVTEHVILSEGEGVLVMELLPLVVIVWVAERLDENVALSEEGVFVIIGLVEGESLLVGVSSVGLLVPVLEQVTDVVTVGVALIERVPDGVSELVGDDVACGVFDTDAVGLGVGVGPVYSNKVEMLFHDAQPAVLETSISTDILASSVVCSVKADLLGIWHLICPVETKMALRVIQSEEPIRR